MIFLKMFTFGSFEFGLFCCLVFLLVCLWVFFGGGGVCVCVCLGSLWGFGVCLFVFLPKDLILKLAATRNILVFVS